MVPMGRACELGMASLLDMPHECLLAVLEHAAVRDWQAFACVSKQARDTVAVSLRQGEG